MLVVMAIIGLLVSLTAGAFVLVINRQHSSNTETILKLLATALDQHYRAVIDQAKKEKIPNDVITLAGGDYQRAQVIWIKLRLKQEFPMTFAELSAPWGPPNPYIGYNDLPPIKAYVEALQQAGVQFAPSGIVDPSLSPQACESAACLLIALQKNRRGVNFDMDQIGSGYVVDGIYANPAGGQTTVKMLVDGWGNPLAFYRWPTACLELNPSPSPSQPATTGFNDPEDPLGLLSSPAWVLDPAPTLKGYWFQQICHALYANTSGNPYAYKVLPTIVSAGADGNLGIPAPPAPQPPVQPYPGLTPNGMDTSQPASFDNIYSYRLISLGARGD
jgi:type II secretory pathway pseudopilin PulG